MSAENRIKFLYSSLRWDLREVIIKKKKTKQNKKQKQRKEKWRKNLGQRVDRCGIYFRWAGKCEGWGRAISISYIVILHPWIRFLTNLYQQGWFQLAIQDFNLNMLNSKGFDWKCLHISHDISGYLTFFALWSGIFYLSDEDSNNIQMRNLY